MEIPLLKEIKSASRVSHLKKEHRHVSLISFENPLLITHHTWLVLWCELLKLEDRTLKEKGRRILNSNLFSIPLLSFTKCTHMRQRKSCVWSRKTTSRHLTGKLTVEGGKESGSQDFRFFWGRHASWREKENAIAWENTRRPRNKEVDEISIGLSEVSGLLSKRISCVNKSSWFVCSPSDLSELLC